MSVCACPDTSLLRAENRTGRLLFLRERYWLGPDLAIAADEQREPPLRSCSLLVLVRSERLRQPARTLAPRADRSFVRVTADDRFCPRSREPALFGLGASRAIWLTGPSAHECQPLVADCVNVRPRGRGPRAGLPGVAAAHGPARGGRRILRGGSARPARLRHAARGRSAPEVLLRISGRRAGCPSGRPCARSSRPPYRRIGSGRRTRCGLRRCRLAPARSS
jgi:hypothetical protein